MNAIMKIPAGPMRTKLQKLWKDNDNINKNMGHRSPADQLALRDKKQALANEANKILEDFRNGVVHEVRSGLMDNSADKKLVHMLESAVKLVQDQTQNKRKWAEDLAAVDPNSSEMRPTSAEGTSSSTGTLQTHSFKTLWSAQVDKKPKVPKGDVPDELAAALRGIPSGCDITLRLKRSAEPVEAVFTGLTAHGMIEVEVQNGGRNPKRKKAALQISVM